MHFALVYKKTCLWIMLEERTNGHSVLRLTVHVVWGTKYRYSVLKGDIQIRYRNFLIQICDVDDVQILQGVVSKDYVHMHIEYRPSQSLSYLIKRLRGRSSRKLQQEFSKLKSKYWVVIFRNRLWMLEYG